jgi:O-antigen/teichoic acid export membrane protein
LRWALTLVIKRTVTDNNTTIITNKDVAKGAGTTLLARLGAVIEILAIWMFGAMFGLPTYGIYAVLWSAVNLVENFADLGMTSALQRTVPQAKTEQEAVASLRAAMIMGVGPCLIIAALVSMFAPYISHIFNAAESDAAQLDHIIAVFVWSLPLWAFVEIATSAIRARRVFGAEIRLRVFWEQIARLGFAVMFWFAGVQTMALFYAHLLSLIVICLLCVRLLSRHYDLSLLASASSSEGMWAETTKAGLAVLPANIVARLFGDGPAIVLNAFLPGAAGATAGGLYAICRKISSIVQLVRTAFGYVLAPLASAASTGGKQPIIDIYGFSTRVSFAVAVPIGFVLAAGGKAILRTFSAGAEVAFLALGILTFARIVEAILGSASPIQQVIGGYKSQLVGSFVGLGVAAAITVAVMPSGGLTGITIAIAVGLITAAAIPLWQLHHYEKLHPFAAPFTKVAISSIAISFVGGAIMVGIKKLPNLVELTLFLPLLFATLWLSMRFALPYADREALGKMAKVLRLI